MEWAQVIVPSPVVQLTRAIRSEKSIALQKLEAIVQAGRDKASRGMEALHREYGLRKDYAVRPEAVNPLVSNGQVLVGFNGRNDRFELTGFSRGQLLARAGIPLTYADSLLELEQGDLLRFNLVQRLPKVSADGILFRTVGATAKGVLSTSYKRLDASPIIEGFIKSAMTHGLVPWRGELTDTRVLLSFIEPKVREVAPGEFVVLGTELRTSDYGNGRLVLGLVVLRLVCINGMTGADMFSKVHLGSRIDMESGGGPIIELSNRTMELDSATVRSMLGDTMKALPPHLEVLDRALRDAMDPTKFKLADAIARLKTKGFRKDVLEQAKALYENSALPVEAVPEAMGSWRFANVLSLLANKGQGDEAIELQDAAFEIALPKGVKVAA